ncbi:MAG: RDD family protein [Acidimicrobiales bacterium]|nr:RDD family protein [Acidimicrobiales bacterium]
MGAVMTTGVVTPEAVLLDFDTAGAGSRTLAEVIDVLLQIIVMILATVALGSAATALAGAEWVAIVFGLMLYLAILVGYPVAMETLWGGRTLGKAALGLRVVTVEGGPERFRHALIRAVIGLVEIWVFLGLPALLAVTFSKRNQRLGDMVAGTFVLRERDALKAGKVAQGFLPPPGYEAYAASIDTTVLSERAYQVVRTFLLRANGLTGSARQSLGINLANAVAGDLRHDPPAGMPPELFLVCVVAAFQRRHGVFVAPAPSVLPMPPGPGQMPPAPGWGGASAPSVPTAWGGPAQPPPSGPGAPPTG